MILTVFNFFCFFQFAAGIFTYNQIIKFAAYATD